MPVLPPLAGGLAWLILALGGLLLSQRLLQRELQAVFLLITRRPAIALVLYSVLFFPGVFLHEASHFSMARLLGVSTGRFSLTPKPLPGGRLRLGFVEVGQGGALRNALIGAAPLLSGGLFVAWAGLSRLHLSPLLNLLLAGSFKSLPGSLAGLTSQPDFWIWFYLVFAISSTMFPSPSDQRGWLPVLLVLIVLLIVGFAAGVGPWLAANATPVLDKAFRGMALTSSISLAVQMVLLPPVFLIRVGISRISRTTLVYR